MSNHRNGNVVLEPIPDRALTADEARDIMRQVEECVPRDVFDTKRAVTVRCFRNSIMTREFAVELYRLITDEYGIPVARFVGPTPDAAAYLTDAASDNPGSLQLHLHDGARTNSRPCKDLGEYLSAQGPRR